MTPGAFERAASVGIIAAALPEIDGVVREMEEVRLRYACMEIAGARLTPAQALSILMEIHSYRELARKLKARVKAAGGTA
jgi:hypothetical protein